MRRSTRKSGSSASDASKETKDAIRSGSKRRWDTNSPTQHARRQKREKKNHANHPEASSKAVSKELDRIDQIFNSYADKSSGMIDPEGIETLCSDLEVDYTDIRVLMLAWKMKAEQQGYFTLEEWRRALKSLKVDTIAKLKKVLPELEKEVSKAQTYEEFYSYAFQYCLTDEKQKSIDIETACEMLDLVLGSQYQSLVESLIEFLKVQTDYKVINMDQWTGFYRFCNEISYPDLSNYDTDLAWPLILDNFVEWMRAKHG